MQEKIKYTLARDIVALGGIPFLLITIARVSIVQPYYPMQFIIGALIFFILRFIWGGNMHAGIGTILLVFISLFYRSWLFFFFALVLYVSMIISLLYLKNTVKEVSKGLFMGFIGTAGSYIIVKLIFLQ